MAYAYSKTGLMQKHFPKDSFYDSLIEEVRDHKELSMDDFRLAFGLFCKNKLDFSESHYQMFDPTWMNKVINSYKRFRNTVNKKHGVNAVEQPKNPVDERTHRQVCQDAYESIEGQTRANNRLPFGGKWIDAYWWASGTGLLIKMDNATKQMYIDKIREEIEHEIYLLRSTGDKIKGQLLKARLNDPAALKVEARTRIIKLHFEQMIKDS